MHINKSHKQWDKAARQLEATPGFAVTPAVGTVTSAKAVATFPGDFK